MDDYCAGCVYRGRAGSRDICEYLLMTGHKRPCPPGENCTVKKMEGDGTHMARQSSFDKERARALYEEGKSTVEVADMVGATESAIKSWIHREGIRRGRPAPAGGTRPEVTVEIPEGLQPAVRRDPPPEPDPPEDAAPEEAVEPATPAMPEPEPEGPPEPDPVERVMAYVRSGLDPVTLTVSCRGCTVRVEAACLDQVAAAGKLLTGAADLLRGLPVSDLKEARG